VTKREDKVLLEGIDGYDLDKEGKRSSIRLGQFTGSLKRLPAKRKSAKASSTSANSR